MRLGQDQIDQYFQQGFLLLKGLIGAEELATYNERFLKIVNGEVALAPAMKIMQDVMVVKGAVAPESAVHGVNKVLCLEDDEHLFAFAHHRALVESVQSLIGDEIYSLSSNVFNKPPGVDGRHPMHQDLRYFKLRPANKIVGVWTAMLPATRDSGCLAVIPGSHEGELLAHDNPDWEYVNFGFFGVGDVDLDARVHIEMQPGDTLLFHPLLVHGSGRNRSGQFRRAISVHYASAACESSKSDWKTNPQTRRIA